MPRQNAPKRVCLAYSGGLDTSVILHWLRSEYGSEVVAFCADVGQEEELSGLPEKARATLRHCRATDRSDDVTMHATPAHNVHCTILP